MAAFLIGTITIRDASLWARYVSGVAESLEPFDAEVVFRGRKLRDLAGEQPRETVVVLRFGDAATADAWFQSERYQQLIPLRDRAADVVITTYSD
ncbi:MAG: DUF1330 domain-containing protein [Marinobacter sp.]|nr:DUF1330 domain-containing protein [Marinobacter sp.]